MNRTSQGIGIVSEIATMFRYAQAMGRVVDRLELAVAS